MPDHEPIACKCGHGYFMHRQDGVCMKCKCDMFDVNRSLLTCWDCPHQNTCEYAWDLYNTDGDCLAEK